MSSDSVDAPRAVGYEYSARPLSLRQYMEAALMEVTQVQEKLRIAQQLLEAEADRVRTASAASMR